MAQPKSVTSLGCCLIAVYLLIASVFAIGYCSNIYKLTQCDFEAPYKAEVIRGIGTVVPPVGAVAGYCTIED